MTDGLGFKWPNVLDSKLLGQGSDAVETTVVSALALVAELALDGVSEAVTDVAVDVVVDLVAGEALEALSLLV